MIARKSLLIFVTNFVGAFLGLASMFAVGRYMNPTAFGMLGFAISLVGIASTIGILGFDKAHIKRISEGQDLATCLGTFARIRTVLTAVFVLVSVIAVVGWDHFMGFFDSTSLTVLLIIILYFALRHMRKYTVSTFNALQMTASAQATALAENLFRAPLIIVAALLFGFLNGRWVPFDTVPARIAEWAGAVGPVTNETGAAMLATAYAISMAASFGTGLWQMRIHDFVAGRFDPVLARRYATFALPIALTGSLEVIAREIDMVMIGYFWSAADVGYYFAAIRLTTIVLIIPTAVRTLFFPMISELASARSHEAVKELAYATQRTMSLVMVLITMFIVVYPAEAIHILLADRWLPAAPVLQLMAINTMLLSIRLVAFTVVQGFDRPQVVARVGIVAVATNLALNFILIPSSILGVPLFGLKGLGAVIATIASQVVANVLITRESRRILGRVHFGWGNVKHIGAAVVTWGLLHLMHDNVLMGVDRVWELAWAGVVGSVIYLAILVAWREVTRKDLNLLTDVLNPRKMRDYVQEEIGGPRKRP